MKAGRTYRIIIIFQIYFYSHLFVIMRLAGCIIERRNRIRYIKSLLNYKLYNTYMHLTNIGTTWVIIIIQFVFYKGATTQAVGIIFGLIFWLYCCYYYYCSYYRNTEYYSAYYKHDWFVGVVPTSRSIKVPRNFPLVTSV